MVQCFLFLAFVLGPDDPTIRVRSDSGPRSRSYTQIDRDISAFLRNEALGKSEFSHAAAIRDLCTIAIEVRFHEKFEQSLMMQTLKNRIRSRLQKIASKTARRYQTQKLSDNEILLAEGTDEPDIDLLLQQNLQLSGFSSGGPLGFFARTHGANGGGIIEQNADDLIRLIQKTIEPSFWDVNGGVGTIAFYAPLNALVIRATEDIHYKIGGSISRLELLNR